MPFFSNNSIRTFLKFLLNLVAWEILWAANLIELCLIIVRRGPLGPFIVPSTIMSVVLPPISKQIVKAFGTDVSTCWLFAKKFATASDSVRELLKSIFLKSNSIALSTYSIFSPPTILGPDSEPQPPWFSFFGIGLVSSVPQPELSFVVHESPPPDDVFQSSPLEESSVFELDVQLLSSVFKESDISAYFVDISTL